MVTYLVGYNKIVSLLNLRDSVCCMYNKIRVSNKTSQPHHHITCALPASRVHIERHVQHRCFIVSFLQLRVELQCWNAFLITVGVYMCALYI